MILSDKNTKSRGKKKAKQNKTKQTNKKKKSIITFALKQLESSYFVCKIENSSFRRQVSTKAKHYFPDVFLKGQLETTKIYM